VDFLAGGTDIPRIQSMHARCPVDAAAAAAAGTGLYTGAAVAVRERNAGAEQRLPCGRVRSGRRRQEFPGTALCARHIPRHIRADDRGHISAGHQL